VDIECSSVIARVVVHARGALVTREVELPGHLPDGIVDVAVPGITLMAQPGSARAALEGSERVVAAVNTALVIPRGEVTPGPTLARVRDLAARTERVVDEHRVLSERRARLAELALAPHLRTLDERKRERDAFDVRFGEALRMAALLDDKVARLDERLLGLEKEQRDLSRALEIARLEDQQTSTRERMGDAHPTRTITARLIGGGRPGKLLVTYAVEAARWWPAYTLRVGEGGARATWTFESVVAQRSGEDWSAVPLSLSSADLVFDARLPELASLRFGRAQPPRRRPFRPAPVGVDEMFAEYLRFGCAAFQPQMERAASKEAMPLPFLGVADQPSDEMAIVVENASFGNAPAVPPPPAGAPPRAAMAMPGAAMPVAPMPMPMPQALRAKSRSRVLGGLLEGGGGLSSSTREALMLADAMSPEPEVEPEAAPSEAWSDHDALVLANADEPNRGRLVPRRDAEGAIAVEAACGEVDLAASDRYRDPAETRGMFDHRYDAAGRADVPSDGRLHRVGVGAAPCAVRLAWRTVPSESAEVYREAHVVNPFDTALLGGPVDVYLDGSLLTTTNIDRIDRGGTLFCGMGVDDRIKVARNVRVDEEAAGLLGGSTAVVHAVAIELSSAVRERVNVTVLERVPVTDDKAVEVKIVRTSPQPATYDQADRGAPVRGGVRFEASVSPNDKTRIELVYRLVFPQKLDIVGGSRRG